MDIVYPPSHLRCIAVHCCYVGCIAPYARSLSNVRCGTGTVDLTSWQAQWLDTEIMFALGLSPTGVNTMSLGPLGDQARNIGRAKGLRGTAYRSAVLL